MQQEERALRQEAAWAKANLGRRTESRKTAVRAEEVN